ncbi:MFS transporter [Halovulum dunhuangense]|uniref:MFS transporter n=1 Tax=Halovulum dunhuangense TaxID=1505036 RepID=A0A849L604_9RHOB|nr:MFS transporter [Halovulum dunhuangense]NNU81584.1 MFS transporter [Halovulum dunhuangense]
MATPRLSRGARAWMLFDWANQPFHTLIITFIFGPYFAAQVVGDPVAGQALWADMNLVAGLSVALLAPVLGAVADASGRRKPWIGGFTLLCAIGCCGLWLAAPGVAPLWPVMVFFVLAFLGSEFALIFSNAMLPDLGPRQEIGRISGSGWAMGYLGGVLALILVLMFLAPAGASDVTLIGLPPLFGLDPASGEPARATGPLSALWFLVFALPLFLYTPDAARRMALGPAIGHGLRSLRGTLGRLPRHTALWRYLLASMVYRDGLAGLFAFGGIYAAGVLGWGLTELGLFGIVAALTGALGAWVGGRADRAFGPRPVIASSIVALIAVACAALATSRTAVLLIPVAAESRLPDITFFLCGAMLGAAGGSLQAASRTMLVHLAEHRLPMTEAFGLYALSGRATAFLAPLLIGIATTASGSQALGVSPVIALFALGLGLLYWVKPHQEARA